MPTFGLFYWMITHTDVSVSGWRAELVAALMHSGCAVSHAVLCGRRLARMVGAIDRTRIHSNRSIGIENVAIDHNDRGTADPREETCPEDVLRLCRFGRVDRQHLRGKRARLQADQAPAASRS